MSLADSLPKCWDCGGVMIEKADPYVLNQTDDYTCECKKEEPL